MKEYVFSNIQSSLPQIYEPRATLMERFKELSNKRIIFVSAPAGYGKTTSTLLWLQQKRQPYLWVSLNLTANIPSLFYRLLGERLLFLQPENELLAEILSQTDFAAAPVEHFIQMIDLNYKSQYFPIIRHQIGTNWQLLSTYLFCKFSHIITNITFATHNA